MGTFLLMTPSWALSAGCDDDVMGAVAGIVLAAGAGRRFGQPKATVDYGGELFVERAARTLRDGGCEPVVVVLGAAAEQVRRRAELSGSIVTDNSAWEAGMGSSLRTGLGELAELDVAAALVLPVDMPGITPEVVRRVAVHADRSALAAASFDGRRRHPVLLGREHWQGVIELAQGDVGAKHYLASHDVVIVPCEDAGGGYDIDRPEDIREHLR